MQFYWSIQINNHIQTPIFNTDYIKIGKHI